MPWLFLSLLLATLLIYITLIVVLLHSPRLLVDVSKVNCQSYKTLALSAETYTTFACQEISSVHVEVKHEHEEQNGSRQVTKLLDKEQKHLFGNVQSGTKPQAVDVANKQNTQANESNLFSQEAHDVQEAREAHEAHDIQSVPNYEARNAIQEINIPGQNNVFPGEAYGVTQDENAMSQEETITREETTTLSADGNSHSQEMNIYPSDLSSIHLESEHLSLGIIMKQYGLKPEQHYVKSEQYDVKSEQYNVKSEQYDVKSEQYDIKSEQHEVKVKEFDLKPEQYDVKPETYMKSEQYRLKPEQHEVEPKQRIVKEESYKIKPEDYDFKSEQYEIDPKHNEVEIKQYTVKPKHHELNPEDFAANPKQHRVKSNTFFMNSTQHKIKPEHYDDKLEDTRHHLLTLGTGSQTPGSVNQDNLVINRVQQLNSITKQYKFSNIANQNENSLIYNEQNHYQHHQRNIQDVKTATHANYVAPMLKPHRLTVNVEQHLRENMGRATAAICQNNTITAGKNLYPAFVSRSVGQTFIP